MKHKNLQAKDKKTSKIVAEVPSKIYPSMSYINPFVAHQLKYRLKTKKNKKSNGQN